jgi:hypothetical protein
VDVGGAEFCVRQCSMSMKMSFNMQSFEMFLRLRLFVNGRAQ